MSLIRTIAAVWLTQILNQRPVRFKSRTSCLLLWWLKLQNSVEQLLFSSLLFSCEPFGYRHSYVNTVQSTCVFATCIRIWDCTQKPFEVPLSLYTPLPHVSSLFEDHVSMIIKAALFPLQTYGMNMDLMMWHQTFYWHPSIRSRPAVWWSLIVPAILNNLCGR